MKARSRASIFVKAAAISFLILSLALRVNDLLTSWSKIYKLDQCGRCSFY